MGEECPVTSVKFQVSNAERDLYEWRQLASVFDNTEGIYISRKVMQQGLYQMTV